MTEPRYWYYKPDSPEPIASEYAPYLCDNLFPLGTQCLDTVRGTLFELEPFYNGKSQMFCEIPQKEHSFLRPELLTHALLLGVTLR